MDNLEEQHQIASLESIKNVSLDEQQECKQQEHDQKYEQMKLTHSSTQRREEQE
jgi:hypothetical protein